MTVVTPTDLMSAKTWSSPAAWRLRAPQTDDAARFSVTEEAGEKRIRPLIVLPVLVGVSLLLWWGIGSLAVTAIRYAAAL